MKTQEFRESVERLGLRIKKHVETGDTSYIDDGVRLFAFIHEDKIYSFSICEDFKYLGPTKKLELQKLLFKFAGTPLEKRK